MGFDEKLLLEHSVYCSLVSGSFGIGLLDVFAYSCTFTRSFGEPALLFRTRLGVPLE